MAENTTYEIYYDKEGDFLEVSFGEPAKEGKTDEVEQEIFVTKDSESGRITDIGIVDFKDRIEGLRKILKRFNLDIPLSIDVVE